MTTAQRTSPTTILVTRTDGATFTITGDDGLGVGDLAVKDQKNAAAWVRQLGRNDYDGPAEIVTVTQAYA